MTARLPIPGSDDGTWGEILNDYLSESLKSDGSIKPSAVTPEVVSQAGTPVVRGPFTFTYDTPNLNNGVEFYTPTVGDILIDAWIVVDEAFDGTTPKADIGTGVGATVGLFRLASDGNYVYLDFADQEAGGAGLMGNGAHGYSARSLLASGGYGSLYNGVNPVGPYTITAANPLLLWASQDGTKGGTAVGGTTGVARLFFVTASPAAL